MNFRTASRTLTGPTAACRRSEEGQRNAARKRRAFTLLELIVVMVIIAILSAIVFSVATSAMTSAKRSRAVAEIAAFEVALTRFEVDNGFAPSIPFISTNNAGYSGNPINPSGIQASRALYFALSGRTKADYDTANPTNHSTYMEFNDSQLGDRSTLGNTTLSQSDTSAYTNAGSFSSGSYLKDPWGNAYGYFYNADADPQSVKNQTRPDIWSTSGDTNASPEEHIRARWLSNWARR